MVRAELVEDRGGAEPCPDSPCPALQPEESVGLRAEGHPDSLKDNSSCSVMVRPRPHRAPPLSSAPVLFPVGAGVSGPSLPLACPSAWLRWPHPALLLHLHLRSVPTPSTCSQLLLSCPVPLRQP